MRGLIFCVMASVVAAVAGPTNGILFVTQVPIPDDFTTIGSVFGNHRATTGSCGRGGDLYIRYSDGSLKNLTRAAGYGVYGQQHTNGIAVRQPCVHWSGKKAVFSMVIGAPQYQGDYSTVAYWQLYEITNFFSPASIPVITKVPNQPTNYNNVSPIYGTDDRIIFTSDRPRNGLPHLYPQLDESEEQPTVSGLWSLQPTNGDLFLLSHTPSGAFSPLLDSAGRVIFVRWDHLQRDQQADIDWENGFITYGTFNWSDETPDSFPTPDQTEVFPEPRSDRTDLLAGTKLVGHSFSEFFPWQINEDGTAEETVNHVGRHEIGGSYANAAMVGDSNLQDLNSFSNHYNTNVVDNFLHIREDPKVAGLFYGIDAPESGTHAAGQLVSLTGATNVNAASMRISYLTPRSTHTYAPSPGSVPSDHTGLYRNPLMTSDGYLICSHTAYTLYESNSGSPYFPTTGYDFRLKFLQVSNGFYVPGALLTGGLTNRASYWSPDYLITQTNLLWELDPVEVVHRKRPARLHEEVAAPELAAFAVAKVDVKHFQDYLRTHELALIVSRDVTTRDQADRLQPFNLRVARTNHQTLGASGAIYEAIWMEILQADQLRGLNYGDPSNPQSGRRVLAQVLHDPAADNPSPTGVPLGNVQMAWDGSVAALVPARRAVSWQLTDTNSDGVVRERYWITFAPGEIRTCASCHGVNTVDQAGKPPPTNMPVALVKLLSYWTTNATVQSGIVADQGTDYFQISFNRRPAEADVTYHVQESADLRAWYDIATYAATNVVLSSQAMEVSRAGDPVETVTVRETAALSGQTKRFLRVNVTRP